MINPDLSRARWVKSSYSNGSSGNCVEVARSATVVAVRDSKNPAGPVLQWDLGPVGEFIRAVKRGQVS